MAKLKVSLPLRFKGRLTCKRFYDYVDAYYKLFVEMMKKASYDKEGEPLFEPYSKEKYFYELVKSRGHRLDWKAPVIAYRVIPELAIASIIFARYYHADEPDVKIERGEYVTVIGHGYQAY